MIGVDVGGTFTDIVAIEKGKLRTVKVMTDPGNMQSSVLAGVKAVHPESKKVFNHASTAGLNAVITRKLPKVAFLTTLGHRDMLDMGRAWRPLNGQTDPNWRRSFGDASAPLVPRYLRKGIKERLTSNGGVLIPLDETQAREQLTILRNCNVEGVAVCLLNSYVNSEHEVRLESLVKKVLGDIPCSISSKVSPLAKEYARASTTVIDVFMKLVFRNYLTVLDDGLKSLNYQGELNLADCAAMLLPVHMAMEQPFQVIFSGPSAGTMSCAYFGRLIGEGHIICCDIGGTSTDIGIVSEGKPLVNTTLEIEHDLIVNTLANEIYSLGAGGGSIVSIGPSGEIKVGPESAGADPGPACYGKGGTAPTLTDACLLMGIVDAEKFVGGKVQLYPELARRAFERLDTSLDLESRIRYAFNIALKNVSEGLFTIAVQHGLDPRQYSLMAYGSAGPMLLAAVMKEIGVKRIIVPPMPGLFSALGLLSTDLVFTRNRSAYVRLSPEAADRINVIYEEMERDLRRNLDDPGKALTVRSFDGHLAGQTWETPFVSVPAGRITGESIRKMIEAFHIEYAKRWGNKFEHMPVVSATYRTQAVLAMDKVKYEKWAERRKGKVAAERTMKLRFLAEQDVDVCEYERDSLYFGDIIIGPAIIREPMSTTLIMSGQTGTVGELGEIIIERSSQQ